MLDDVGFGAAGTFGGLVNTPTLDKLSRSGLIYTYFHTTSMCSPTRAALLTGRNHHVAHTGTVVDWATGYPGYDTLKGKDTATFARCSSSMASARAGSGRTTTYRHGNPARQDHSTAGQPNWGLTTSTGSSAATPTSGAQLFDGTKPIGRTSAILTITWTSIWPTRQSTGSTPACHGTHETLRHVLRARRHACPHHPLQKRYVDQYAEPV